MIELGISIPNVDKGTVNNIFTKYGFIYLSSDNILEAPIKEFEKTSYPEERGEHMYPKTVFSAFDYNVTFVIEDADVNGKIQAFNKDLFTKTTDNDVLSVNTITIYNYYKKVKIVGIPTLLSTPDNFWVDRNKIHPSIAEVTLTIRVTDPSLCDFNYDR